MPQDVKVTLHYTDEYKDTCFQVWYLRGRCSMHLLAGFVPEDANGRRPSNIILQHWRDDDNWNHHADLLDAQVQQKLDARMIDARIQMFDEQAKLAKELQTRGLDHIREMGFDTSASAVNAIFKGAELERISKGATETLAHILELDDKQLTNMVKSLLDRQSQPSVTVAGEILEEEQTEDNLEKAETDEI
jgi:hypothetical protein